MEILQDSISSADPIGTTLPGCHQHLCALLSKLPESKSFLFRSWSSSCFVFPTW